MANKMKPAVRTEEGKEGIREAAFLVRTGVFRPFYYGYRHTNEVFRIGKTAPKILTDAAIYSSFLLET